MSNHLAIAMATETLRQIIDNAASTAVAGANAVAARPDSGVAPVGPQVRLFLYQVTPNANWRGDDLPTRRGDGAILQRPQVALDLHYLLTFYGDETDFQPQRLLGSVAGVLHSRPVLSRDLINDIHNSLQQSNPGHELLKSDLANQIDQVRVTPSPLNLEELSKLWSVFFQTTYELSVAYQASVVLIETRDIPSIPLPVKQYGLYVIPFPQPTIDNVIAATGEYDPIQAGTKIVIKGNRLKGDITNLSISGHDFTASITELLSDKITVQLPTTLPTKMRVGIHSVRITHQLQLGQPATPHKGFESNVVAFVLRPKLSPVPTLVGVPVSKVIDGVTFHEGTVRVNFNPTIGIDQQVVLLLNEKTSSSPAQSYSFVTPKNNGITATGVIETNVIDFNFEKVMPGDYLLRVQVDGAESPLEQNQVGEYDLPSVTL